MALIPCPECGHMVSPNADACPGCGAPVSTLVKNHPTDNHKSMTSNNEEGKSYLTKRGRVLGVIAAIVLIVIVVGCVLIWPRNEDNAQQSAALHEITVREPDVVTSNSLLEITECETPTEEPIKETYYDDNEEPETSPNAILRDDFSETSPLSSQEAELTMCYVTINENNQLGWYFKLVNNHPTDTVESVIIRFKLISSKSDIKHEKYVYTPYYDASTGWEQDPDVAGFGTINKTITPGETFEQTYNGGNFFFTKTNDIIGARIIEVNIKYKPWRYVKLKGFPKNSRIRWVD